jgi:hypothetical protein
MLREIMVDDAKLAESLDLGKPVRKAEGNDPIVFKIKRSGKPPIHLFHGQIL